jgi:IclR family acetate operon transcriptional repressor
MHGVAEMEREVTGLGFEGDVRQSTFLAPDEPMLRVAVRAGQDLELPLLHSSAARVIAAHLPANELETFRRVHPALDDEATLARARRRGWAVNDREIVPDARVVGAPILSSDGYPLGALILSGPTSRISADRMKELARLVGRTAADDRPA